MTIPASFALCLSFPESNADPMRNGGEDESKDELRKCNNVETARWSGNERLVSLRDMWRRLLGGDAAVQCGHTWPQMLRYASQEVNQCLC